MHEDAHLAVIEKPPGVVTHPGAGRTGVTLAAGVLHRWPSVRGVGTEDRWGIVHRLDRDTSGLMVVALTAEADVGLRAAIKAHQITREYLTLVHGAPAIASGTIEAPLGRDPVRPTRIRIDPNGRPATTHYRIEERLGDMTLLRVTLESGRTHQVRVHLASIGFPIAGDRTYGRGEWQSASVSAFGPFGLRPPGDRGTCRRRQSTAIRSGRGPRTISLDPGRGPNSRPSLRAWAPAPRRAVYVLPTRSGAPTPTSSRAWGAPAPRRAVHVSQTRSGAPTPDLLPSMGAPAPRRAVYVSPTRSGAPTPTSSRAWGPLPHAGPSLAGQVKEGYSRQSRSELCATRVIRRVLRLADPVGGPNPDLLPSMGAPAPRRAVHVSQTRAGPQPRPPPERGGPLPHAGPSLVSTVGGGVLTSGGVAISPDPGGAPTPPSSRAWGPCPTPGRSCLPDPGGPRPPPERGAPAPRRAVTRDHGGGGVFASKEL